MIFGNLLFIKISLSIPGLWEQVRVPGFPGYTGADPSSQRSLPGGEERDPRHQRLLGQCDSTLQVLCVGAGTDEN